MGIHQRFTTLRDLFLEGVTVQFAWQHHARLPEETYPLGAHAVLEHCYMDDLMPSTPTADDAKETRKQLTELGDLAGFYIHKWM